MKSLPSSELKKIATTPGPEQYLAFDELATRERNKPPELQEPNNWEPLSGPLKPIHKEWAFLKWSQRLNVKKDHDLRRRQNERLRELERQLDDETDSLELKYFNAIGEELHRLRPKVSV